MELEDCSIFLRDILRVLACKRRVLIKLVVLLLSSSFTWLRTRENRCFSCISPLAIGIFCVRLSFCCKFLWILQLLGVYKRLKLAFCRCESKSL